jgi:hypothetical protein
MLVRLDISGVTEEANSSLCRSHVCVDFKDLLGGPAS